MVYQVKTSSGLSTLGMLLGVTIVSACAPWTLAQDDKAQTPFQKVDPCIVTIMLDNQSEGSGFLIDARGWVVTNYHVVEGAKSATIVLADKKSARVEGFLAVNPTKDLALLKIQADGPSLPTLQIAENQPARGDRVFAFGAPLGLTGSVSDGIVAAIRPGTEVRDTLEKLAHSDVYTKSLGYDLDAQWIQSTAPISPGNSGGPLVNADGDVVGVNTWVCAAGQNLSFSLSAVHLRQFVATASVTPQPFANLPAPRPGIETRAAGNVEKTMLMWKQLNKAKYALEGQTSAVEKKLQQLNPADPRNPRKGETQRNKKKLALYEELAKIYAEHADNVKALDNADVDSDAARLAFVEAELAQRTGDACEELATALATDSLQNRTLGEAKLEHLKKESADLRLISDIVRIKLNRKYGKEFPTVRETARALAKGTDSEPAAAKDAGNAKKDDRSSATAAGSKEETVAIAADRLGVLRSWTDRTGHYQVRAKCLGVEGGRAKLEKVDGSVVFVPISSLSEADQRFLGIGP